MFPFRFTGAPEKTLHQPVSQHSTFAFFCLSALLPFQLCLSFSSPLCLPSPISLPLGFWASPYLPLPLCPSTPASWPPCLCISASTFLPLPLYLYFSTPLDWPVWLTASQPLLLPLSPGLSLHSSAFLPLSLSPSASASSLPSSPLLCLYLSVFVPLIFSLSNSMPHILSYPLPMCPSASMPLCLYAPRPLCSSFSMPLSIPVFMPNSLSSLPTFMCLRPPATMPIGLSFSQHLLASVSRLFCISVHVLYDPLLLCLSASPTLSHCLYTRLHLSLLPCLYASQPLCLWASLSLSL